jgi:hypothetical protein
MVIAVVKLETTAGIGDTQGDAFRRNREETNRSSLEFGVPMYLRQCVSQDSRTCRNGLTVLALVMSRGGWMVKMRLEKAAEEYPPEEWSATATVVIV